MEPIYQKDRRDGYTYDAAIKRGDTTFWAEVTGAIATDSTSNKVVVRVSSARLHSYLQHIFGEYEFRINVPANPGTTPSHTWGLRNPHDTQVSTALFSIDTDAVFSVISSDNFGNLQTTAVAWDTNWSGTDVVYKINWEEDLIRFLINDTLVATHSTRVGNKPSALELRNGVASSFDVSTVRVARAGAII